MSVEICVALGVVLGVLVIILGGTRFMKWEGKYATTYYKKIIKKEKRK